MCKSLYYPRFLGPCFTQAVFSPPPICSEINCKPVVPAFSSNITLQELTTFGFPPVDPSLHAGLSFQLLAAEVRYLTPDVTNFCDVDAELQHWCGHSAEVFPNRFKYDSIFVFFFFLLFIILFRYCIVAETWPIVDMQGWMQNTTFGATLGVNNVFYPYICLCHIPTSPFERPRAYFVPKNVYAVFDYSPNCGEEHAMLAMYLLFMLFALVVFILVLYDTFLLISLTLTQKRGMFIYLLFSFSFF